MRHLLLVSLLLSVPGLATEPTCPKVPLSDHAALEKARYRAQFSDEKKAQAIATLARRFRHGSFDCSVENDPWVRELVESFPNDWLVKGYVLSPDGRYDGTLLPLLQRRRPKEVIPALRHWLEEETRAHLDGNFWSLKDHYTLLGEIGGPEVTPFLIQTLDGLERKTDLSKTGALTIVISGVLQGLGSAGDAAAEARAKGMCDRIFQEGDRNFQHDCFLTAQRLGGVTLLDAFMARLKPERVELMERFFLPAFAHDKTDYVSYCQFSSAATPETEKNLVTRWQRWYRTHHAELRWDPTLGHFIAPSERAGLKPASC